MWFFILLGVAVVGAFLLLGRIDRADSGLRKAKDADPIAQQQIHDAPIYNPGSPL